jgi:hypothetical protein
MGSGRSLRQRPTIALRTNATLADCSDLVGEGHVPPKRASTATVPFIAEGFIVITTVRASAPGRQKLPLSW